MTPATATASVVREPAAIERAYDALLHRCLDEFDEAVLQAGHDFGREALRGGLGVLDVVDLHHRLLDRQLAAVAPAGVPAKLDHARRLLLEALAPFEMIHRGVRAAHSALKASEERYRDLFEHARDAIFTTDLEGRITSINEAGRVLTGYGREEALGLKLTALIGGDAKGRRRRRALRLERVPDHRRYELEVLTKDGRRVPVEVSLRRTWAGGQPAGLQGIARDITDRRNAESALRYLNQRLEDKARRIAHGLHDEAGQLLASVYLRVAEIAADLPPPARRRMEDLRVQLDQVDDQLRRLAHELRPTVLDDLGLLPACHLLAEGVAKRYGIKISVSGSTRGRLPADVELALYRVVQEALSNVARHAQARTVTVRIERAGRRVHGYVRDDGRGFDPASLARDLGHRRLGVSGMRERLIAVGGRLDVRSTAGHGTSVDFELPLEG